MFHRDCIVSLKACRWIYCKEVSKPLRHKYLYLFFLSEREIRTQADDPALHFRQHVFFLRTGSEYSQWLSTPKGCFSTSLTPFNYIKGKLIWKGQTQKQLYCFCFVYKEFELLRNMQLRCRTEQHRTSCAEGQTLDIRQPQPY